MIIMRGVILKRQMGSWGNGYSLGENVVTDKKGPEEIILKEKERR